jgi:integrase
MLNPRYLALSRHNVFYLRFPIPKALHPQGKTTHVKFSLKTRHPEEALQLARLLFYVGEEIMRSPHIVGASLEQIKQTIKSHFLRGLEKRKERIALSGPLKGIELVALQNSYEIAAEAIQDNDFWLAISDEEVDRSAIAYGFQCKQGDKEWLMLRSEIVKARRDLSKTMLDYNQTGGSYDFSTPVPVSAPVRRGEKLTTVLEDFVSEKLQTKSWTDKSAKAYKAQYALLEEYLGPNASMHISADVAYDIKKMLMSIPKNRLGKAERKTLSELRAMEFSPAARMSPQSVNKYLGSYSTFYQWAVNQGKTAENPFKNILLNLGPQEQVRDHFTHEQILKMVHELQTNSRGLINKEYQKWGTLIGLYTGARLNEIAQLELTDIRQVEGVWCFDINDDGEGDKDESRKRLKNKPSKRLVPIHSHLISWGVLEHAENLRKQGKKRLLHELVYDAQNGYGRNLSRWFNERFLPELGIKTKRLVFHSFRHTVMTLLIQAGVEHPLAQDIVGHKKAGMMHASYVKGFLSKQRQEALEKILQDLPIG